MTLVGRGPRGHWLDVNLLPLVRLAGSYRMCVYSIAYLLKCLPYLFIAFHCACVVRKDLVVTLCTHVRPKPVWRKYWAIYAAIKRGLRPHTCRCFRSHVVVERCILEVLLSRTVRVDRWCELLGVVGVHQCDVSRVQL